MTALAVASTEHLGHQLPLWSVVPFGMMLLSIAFLPMVAGGLWEYNRNKAFVSLVAEEAVRARRSRRTEKVRAPSRTARWRSKRTRRPTR
jgi:hypothetical protein